MTEREVIWVDTEGGLAELAREIDRASILAIDTEQDAFFAYRPKVCLVQIAVGANDYIVDPLAVPDLSILRKSFLDPTKVKIFHAADNDIALLKRDHGLAVRGLFDTMSAASILGYKRTGLAALIEMHFGIPIEKKYQRSDWRRRPLEPGQIEYAALDVRFLDELREILIRELEQAERWEEATSDFERIERVAHEMRPFDPDDYYRIQGVRQLDGTGRRILRDLYVFRDTLAREDDRAPYRVCSDSVLFALAERRPEAVRDLAGFGGLPDRVIQQHGRTIIDLIDDAIEDGEIAPPPPPPREHVPLDDAERALFDALRDWRRKRAEARGVDPGRVVPNALLMSVVRSKARTTDELAGAGLEPWRVREYGADILAVVQKRSRGATDD